MTGCKFSISTNLSRTTRIALLAFSWLAGMLLGLYIAGAANSNNTSMMRTVVSSGVSIVGLLAVLLLPLSVTAIAVYVSAPILFLPLAFCKAFGFSYCSFLILTAFGGAGWLVRCLLLFSDSCMSMVLLWFWIRNLCGIEDTTKRDLRVCAILALAVGLIDYFIVSPFLWTLFQ